VPDVDQPLAKKPATHDDVAVVVRVQLNAVVVSGTALALPAMNSERTKMPQSSIHFEEDWKAPPVLLVFNRLTCSLHVSGSPWATNVFVCFIKKNVFGEQ